MLYKRPHIYTIHYSIVFISAGGNDLILNSFNIHTYIMYNPLSYRQIRDDIQAMCMYIFTPQKRHIECTM